MRLSRFLAFAFLLPVLSGLMLAGCSSPVPLPPTKYVSQFKGLLPEIMENDSGLFHGIILGMKPEEVKHFSIKSDSLSLEEKGTLILEGKLSAGKEYAYECNFDEKGLHTIILDIHLKDQPNADSLLDDFKKYFTLKYGPFEMDRDIYTWLPPGGARPAKIQLQEEPDYTYGKLTISIFDQTFDMQAPAGNDSLIVP